MMVTSVLANAPPNAGSAGPVIACRMTHGTPQEMLLAADESRTGPTDPFTMLPRVKSERKR